MGVSKLAETNAVVDGLQAELVKLEPVLREKSIETEGTCMMVGVYVWIDVYVYLMCVELLARVAKDSAEAELVASKVCTCIE